MSNVLFLKSVQNLGSGSVHHLELHSGFLHRPVLVDVFLPPGYEERQHDYCRTLYLNDGQDALALRLRDTLDDLHHRRKLFDLIVVAVRCGNERIQEYGTANVPDYLQRGSKARDYTRFILKELFPYIKRSYRVMDGPQHTGIAGFSLGGLSAFDIAWHHADLFGKVGVFSGSFWWRYKPFNDDYDEDHDRIAHNIVRYGERAEGLRFWFEVGTNDETEDRNQNGIIDAIEDTLDLIDELVKKEYDEVADIRYVEIVGGEHTPRTWAECLPDFLTWAFGR